MKALSIRQPWASLIAHGIKDVENRTWRTNYRGRIYIHASAKAVKDGWGVLNYDQKLEIASSPLYYKALDNLPFGAIIGEVDIVGCVINDVSVWAEKSLFADLNSDSNTRDVIVWNWILANPVLYDKQILNVKGKLSFWEFEK